MKATSLLFTLFVVALISCSKRESNPTYQINGTITADYEGYIYMRYLNSIDSALVKDNEFLFTGSLPHVVEAAFSPDKGPSADGFYFGNEVVNITINKEDRYFFNQEVKSKTMQLMDSVEEVFGDIMENNANPNQQINEFAVGLATKYPDNQFITEILGDIITEANLLTLEQSQNLVTLIDLESMVPDYYESMMTGIERMKNLNVGDPFIEFELTDLNGNTVKPSDFKGKYLLVDLWASWCGPCRKANPELIKLYNRYQDKGLEIMSLSLDRSESAWKKAVAKDQLTWANVRAEEGFASPIARELGVVFLPFNYLIDPEGKIVKINIDLETVQTEMDKL